MWSDWYDEYLARDPPDEDMFPRFQFWNDQGWGDYQAKVSKSLRDEHFAVVDLGTFEEVAYKYQVHVVDDFSWEHEDVDIAVNNVRHHHFWKNDEFKHQVVGWQSRVQEDGAKKTKTRPVRRLTNPDVSQAVVLLLLLMYYYYNYCYYYGNSSYYSY